MIATFKQICWWFILFVGSIGGWTAACFGVVGMIITAVDLDLVQLLLTTAITFVGVAAEGLSFKPMMKLMDAA